MRSHRHPHLHPVDAPSLVRPGLEPSPVRRVIDANRWCAHELSTLADIIGGVDILESLPLDPVGPLEPLDPVEPEPFDWKAVPGDDKALVRDLLDRIENFCDLHVDTEYLTILRRLLAGAAAHETRPLRRRSSPQRIAAALVWIALKGNMSIGRGQRYSGEALWYLLGVNSCTELGRNIAEPMGMTAVDEPLLGRGGFPCDPIVLGDVDLLHSRTRAWIARQRDQSLDVYRQLEAREVAGRPVVDRGNGRIEVRGRDVNIVGAMKGIPDGGRATVMVLLGDSVDDVDDVLALSVPTAHRLVAQLQAALDAPLQLRR